MKTSNGKLLGTTKSDLDNFKEKIERRCDRLENSLVNEQQQQIIVYKKGLEKVYYLQQVLGKQIKELETKQNSYARKGLLSGFKSSPNKLLWFNFFMSLAVGIIASWGLIKVSFQDGCLATVEPAESFTLQAEN